VIADINGDGKPDILTGKRFMAHNGNDPGREKNPSASIGTNRSRMQAEPWSG